MQAFRRNASGIWRVRNEGWIGSRGDTEDAEKTNIPNLIGVLRASASPRDTLNETQEEQIGSETDPAPAIVGFKAAYLSPQKRQLSHHEDHEEHEEPG